VLLQAPVPATWHCVSGAAVGQTTAAPAVQAPAWQESFAVQPLLSLLQDVPLLAFVVTQPRTVSHTALWHWPSVTEQVFGVPFTHWPLALQDSFVRQALPVEQA